MNNTNKFVYSVATYYNKQNRTKTVQADFNEYKDASDYFYACLTEEVRFCGLCQKQWRTVVLIDNEEDGRRLKEVTIISKAEQPKKRTSSFA